MLGGEFHVPFWVVITCQAAMALGTLFGGWRIVHTMGSRITRLTPMQGFCAETGGAITLFLATWPGHSGLHHPHHHRRDRRRRRRAAGLGGALERGHGHRDGLVHHHAGRGADRRGVLLAGGGVWVRRSCATPNEAGNGTDGRRLLEIID